jgi:hypothetical protein
MYIIAYRCIATMREIISISIARQFFFFFRFVDSLRGIAQDGDVPLQRSARRDESR